ncbi:MAG: hypothetical protein SFX19_04245 [Alphaproteobacteria bacterium]|nr:hypothetical protein [Alphaproteobacteria bacterium]
MALTPADQAYLVLALEDHLADQIPAAVDAGNGISGAAFLAELERRSHAYKAGKMDAHPAGDVMAELRTRQATENVQ